MKELITTFVGAIMGAIFFGGLCLVFDAPTFQHFAWAIGVGAFIGALAAPEFSPDSYRNPRLFQTIAGAGVGLSASFFFGWPMLHIAIATLVGAIVGFFAHIFIDLLGTHAP